MVIDNRDIYHTYIIGSYIYIYIYIYINAYICNFFVVPKIASTRKRLKQLLLLMKFATMNFVPSETVIQISWWHISTYYNWLFLLLSFLFSFNFILVSWLFLVFFFSRKRKGELETNGLYWSLFLVFQFIVWNLIVRKNFLETKIKL